MSTASLPQRAAAAYSRAIADPKGFALEAGALVAEARRGDDPESLVLALRAYAWAERGQLEHERARHLLDEAAAVARRRRLDARLRDVLVTRAAVSSEMGRMGAAQRDLHLAADLARHAPAYELVLQQAALHQNVGRLGDAARGYRRLLDDPECPDDVRAKAGNNLALIEAHRGRPDLALRHVENAMAVARVVGPAMVAITAQSRAWVIVQAGRLTEAVRAFDEAARLYKAAGLTLGEHYLEYADALADLRLLPEASAMAQRAAVEFEAHGVALMAAEARLRVARLALLSGRYAEAEAAASAAAKRFSGQRRASWAATAVALAVEAAVRTGSVTERELSAVRQAARTLEARGVTASAVDAHLTAGEAALRLGREGVAVGSWLHAQELARRAPVLVRLKGRVAGALGARLREDRAGTLRQCRAGLADLARHRDGLPSLELRALASGHGARLGRLGLEVLLRDGAAARVLDWMERTRAAALSIVEPPVTGDIEAELAELRGAVAQLDPALRRAPEEPPELSARRAAIEARVRRSAWVRAVGLRDAEVLSSAHLRTRLEGQALVEYGVLEEDLFAVVVASRRIRLVRLGTLAPVRQAADALLFALRRLAQPRTPALSAAARAIAEAQLRRLDEALLAPLGVPADVPLVVVPFAVLHRIPWGELHGAPVTVAPSASFWARTRERAGSVRGGRTVLVAGPELPWATAEVEALRGLHRDATVLVPPASTVRAVSDALDGAGLAHLACHGLLRSDNPMFSSLVLSDGPLTVHEMDLRAIAPQRMVLAACDSGVDVGVEGNEMLGFVSALFARGTAGLVASLVAVPDVEALPLMRALHERLGAGDTLAQALHVARAAMDRQSAAAFVTACAFNSFGAA